MSTNAGYVTLVQEVPVIDVEEYEITPVVDILNDPGLAFTLNKYACDVISMFNEKHRTRFKVVMGMSKGHGLDSHLNKQECAIYIEIGKLSTKRSGKDVVEALKLAVGHEIAHHVYANMSLSALDSLAMTANRIAGTYRRIVMSCSIDVAADLHAQNFYKQMGEHLNESIYTEYLYIIKKGRLENEKTAGQFIKNGELPPSYRLRIMKKYNSFRGNDYEVLDVVMNDISNIAKRYMGKRLGLSEYKKWIRTQMELDNFPVRVNRVR